jgi:hypothetical protein
MKFSLFTRRKRPVRLLLFLSLVAVLLAQGAESAKPVLLYSRYFNAAGETRYLPDGTFQQVLSRLREQFIVRIHQLPLTSETLAGVNVVLIANPSDKAVPGHQAPNHVSARDIDALTAFVETGGGLIVMGNQENHNLEVANLNKLLAHFGLQFTNLYTDAKKLVLPRETPIIGGLRWAYYTGNLVEIKPGHTARPQALVKNDLDQKPVKGLRDQRGALLALAEPGRGRVAVVTDSGWLTDDALNEKGIGDVAIKGQDNFEIFLRLATWAAGAAK